MAACKITDEEKEFGGWTCISKRADDNTVDTEGTGLFSIWEGLEWD